MRNARATRPGASVRSFSFSVWPATTSPRFSRLRGAGTSSRPAHTVSTLFAMNIGSLVGTFEVHHHSEYLAMLVQSRADFPRGRDSQAERDLPRPVLPGPAKRRSIDAPAQVAGAVRAAAGRPRSRWNGTARDSFCCGGGGGAEFRRGASVPACVNQEASRQALAKTGRGRSGRGVSILHDDARRRRERTAKGDRDDARAGCGRIAMGCGAAERPRAAGLIAPRALQSKNTAR